jgi:transposase
MTITGVNLAVAAGIVAAIGEISRFNSPPKLVSYIGLNPRVRQSGLGAAHHGRISKIGRSHARAMLVEAAWAAAKAPGPLHAFFVRVRARRGHQIAAVAVARKLTVLCWHLLTKGEDYQWRAQRWSPTRPPRCNFKPDIRKRKVADVDQPTLTTSSRCATARC